MTDIKKDSAPLRILISGGGTGGHIFPAVSIADELKRRHPDAEIEFVGAMGRMEMQRVPAAGYKITGLPVMGFDRKRLWRNFKVLWRLWRSMRGARAVVKRLKPHIAIGVGGYASGPTLKAAQRAGVPTMLQEQNSYPGVTNRMLSGKAVAICTAYEGLERWFPAQSITLTGNPIRTAILAPAPDSATAKERLGFDPAKPVVLCVGGSLGARTVNEAMIAALDNGDLQDAQVLLQTGPRYLDEVTKRAAGNPAVHVQAFVDDMALAYAAADIVVSRAGAGTVSELQVLGKPCILLPSPNVAEDHQRKNALALADKNAAVMVEDALAVQQLGPAIRALLDHPDQRQAMHKAILAMARPDATARIADIAEKIMQQ